MLEKSRKNEKKGQYMDKNKQKKTTHIEKHVVFIQGVGLETAS